jgi:hypothetical protein
MLEALMKDMNVARKFILTKEVILTNEIFNNLQFTLETMLFN